jgi:Holliday junction resolvase RusA-like endonuclease
VTTLPFTVTLDGRAVGKGRPRASFKNGVFRVHEDVKTARAERSVKQELALAWKAEPTKESLSLTVEIRVQPPVSMTKRDRALAMAAAIFPRSKPDLDNVVKLLADAGNKTVWHDDAQITRLFVSRRYAEAAGITLTVERA